MVEIIKYPLVLSLIFVALISCNNREIPVPQKEELPERIDTLENLTVYTPQEQDFDTVELVRDQTYGDAEEIFIGWVSELAVDDRGRVYIAEGEQGRNAVYVYAPDGRYLTTLGNPGRGPGEFGSIQGMAIRDNQLHVSDSQRKISVFSLDDLTHSYDELIKKDKIEYDEELAQSAPGNQFFIRDDGRYILKFTQRIFSNENRTILYYELAEDGNILPSKLIELKAFDFFMHSRSPRPGIPSAFTMPFSRSSLIAVADDGTMFTAWTEDFLIKEYDKEGNYRRAFYYPYQKNTLSLEDMEISDGRRRILDNSEVPGTWPTLHRMLLDNQDRLWVFTITDSKTHYQGWVLDRQGQLLARFNWPGNRNDRIMVTDKPMVIKDGYLYNYEEDTETGLEEVVRYRIEMGN